MPEHQMVEELHVEQSRRGEDLGGEAQIFIRRLWIATWVVVDERKPNTAVIEDGPQQFTDANACPSRRADIHLVQREQSVAPIDDGYVQLLLRCAAKDWE